MNWNSEKAGFSESVGDSCDGLGKVFKASILQKSIEHEQFINARVTTKRYEWSDGKVTGKMLQNTEDTAGKGVCD